MIPNQSNRLIQKYNAYLILDKILFNLSPNTYLTLLISIGNSDLTLRSPPNVNSNCFPMNFKCQELINVVSDQKRKHAAANNIIFSIQIHGPNNQIISNGELKINPCLFVNSEMTENRPFMIDLSNTNSPLMIFASFSLIPYQINPPQKFSIFQSKIQPVSVVQQNRINIEPDNLSNLLSDYNAFSDEFENIDDTPIYNRKPKPPPNNNEIEYNRPREYQEQMDPKLNKPPVLPFQGQSTPIPQSNNQPQQKPAIQREQSNQQQMIQQQQSIKQQQLKQQQMIQQQELIKQQQLNQQQELIKQEQLNQQQMIQQPPKSPPIQIQQKIAEQPPSSEINKTPIQQIQQQEPIISNPISPNTNQQIPIQNEVKPFIQLPQIESVEPAPVENQNENQGNNLSNELIRLQEQMKRNEEVIKLIMREIPPDVLCEIAASIPGFEFPSIEQPEETKKEEEKVQQESEQLHETKEEKQQEQVEQTKEKEVVQTPEVVEPKKERDPIYNEIEEISQSLENVNRVFCFLQTIPPDILIQVLPPFEDDETPQQQIEPQENVDNNEQQPKEATEPIQEVKENEQKQEPEPVTSTIPEEPKTIAQLKEELSELETEFTNNVKSIYNILQMIPPEVLVEVLNGMPPLEFDELINIDTSSQPLQQDNNIKSDISSIQQFETPNETTEEKTQNDNSQINLEQTTPKNTENEQKENAENVTNEQKENTENATNEQKENVTNEQKENTENEQKENTENEQKSDFSSDLNQQIDLLAHSAADTEQAIRNIVEIVPPEVLTEVMQNMPQLNMEESNDIVKETENSIDLNMTQRIPLNIISEIQTQLSNE